MKIYAENIRSLSSPVDVELRPLTIITGENSAGKSTFLAAATLALQPGFPFGVDFNSYSLNLGSYETIATNKGGRYGIARSFTLGYHTSLKGQVANDQIWKEVHGTFNEQRGNALLSCLEVRTRDIDLDLKRVESEKDLWRGKLKVRSRDYELEGPIGNAPSIEAIIFSLIPPDRARGFMQAEGDYRILFNNLTGYPVPSVTPLAPLRTRPRRTYDKPTLNFSAEGDHIPYQLATAFDESDGKQTKLLKHHIEQFGHESGLFNSIKVNRFGSNADPFQIQIQVYNKAFNLIDVGYGVSQMLPILVESVLSDQMGWIFLQQPEVHLHPRAQAALGSFFVDLVSLERKQFVVETHSDYIIDRIRLEVARGKIRNDDVQILFFERNGYDTTIHTILIDEQGNILNTPSGYRSFFLEEEISLFNRVLA